MNPLNVVYILLHFPYLTETFVADEIQAVRSQGINIKIISLLEPGVGPVQPLSEQLLSHTWYAPHLLTLSLWRAQFYFLFKSPGLYNCLLLQLLRQPSGQSFILLAKRLVIFLKAVAAAYYLEGQEVQVLHSHFAWLSGAATWITARLLGLPFTVTAHAYDIYALNDLLPLVTDQADHVVAISEYNRKYIARAGNCPVEAISVIHCGVNLAQLPQPANRIEQPEPRPLRLLTVGSLVAKKGHTHLISACSLLKQQGFNFTCTIIGGGSAELSLRQQIEDHGLSDLVKLWGPRPHPEIIEAYEQHDLFVLASVITPGGDRDGIPVVLMEAGAMGLPLISTEVSGIPELVRHKQTGWLVPPGDAPALAEAITILGTNPALRASLGQNAQALVEAEYGIDSNAARLAYLFRQLHQQRDYSLKAEV